jgi:hypothetical protein
MAGGQRISMMETQTKLEPGDLVFTHPQDNPEHIKRLPSYAHLTPYLVLSVDASNRPTDETWYRLISTSKVSGETRFVKLPGNMLTRYEELNERDL